MEFEWDENKRLSNIAKHGFDFVDVWQVFAGDYIEADAKRGADGERRVLATGLINDVYATLIFAVRGPAIRVISLRKARSSERKQHQALHRR